MGSRARAPALGREDGARRKALENPGLRAYIEEIAREAESARSRGIPGLPFSSYRAFDESGDRSAFEALYFERRRALVALALASWLWRKEADAAALEDLIWAICDEYSWALPAHLGGASLDPAAKQPELLDLFSCETAFALAEITSLLEPSLAPIVVGRARLEVERRVLGPFLARREPWPWELMRSNWCAVCAGSVGAAALYLARDEARRGAILERVLPTLGRFLESFAADGACLEGLGYWTYGVGFFVSFADLLNESGDGGIDLMAADGFRRIAAFQSKSYLNDSLAVSFADGAVDERYRRGLTAYLASRFPEAPPPAASLAAGYGHDRCGRWCLSFRDLLWAGRAEGAGGAAAAFPGESEWLPDAQWLIRPAPPGGGLALAAKGGSNDEPHNHNDVGSFQLVLGERQFLADLGSGLYTRDYFNEKRYSVFCNSSTSHNLPIIAGRGQEAGAERRARDVAFRREGARATLAMDIASAYDCPSLLRLRRSLEFDGSSLLIVKDELEFSRPGIEVTERFVTTLPAFAITPRRGGSLALEAGGKVLAISCSLPGLEPRISIREHLDHEGLAIPVACIDYALPREAAIISVTFEFRLVS